MEGEWFGRLETPLAPVQLPGPRLVGVISSTVFVWVLVLVGDRVPRSYLEPALWHLSLNKSQERNAESL